MNELQSLGLTRGKKITNIVCHDSHLFGDLVVIWDNQKKCKCFTKSSIASKKPVSFKINEEEIIDAVIPQNWKFIILTTTSQTYFRTLQNQPLDAATEWEDFYLEPFTQHFFRKDQYGNWFDIDGYKLPIPIFLIGDTLISLVKKNSKKSLFFKNQPIVVSPNFELIQVGKIVLGNDLQLINFLGDKITGLGNKYFVFQNGDALQEVRLGLDRKGFLFEQSKAPFLINKEIVVQHLESVEYGRDRYEVFKTENSSYAVTDRSTEAISCDGKLVSIDFSTYVNLCDCKLAHCTDDEASKFMDLHRQSTFYLPEWDEDLILTIDPKSVFINEDNCWNIETTRKQFVYQEKEKKIFALNEETLFPIRIADLENFENFYGSALLGKVEKLFSKKDKHTLQIGTDKIELEAILSSPDLPLLNAFDIDGQKRVIDARRGLDDIDQAMVGDQEVVQVFGKPFQIGNSYLQNALLKTLGGTEKRVLNLSKEKLSIYNLPNDLVSDAVNKIPSVYCNSPIHELDFENIIEVDGEEFIEGKFIPFREDLSSILIQRKNNRPLHLEGGGHRNELVTNFNPLTISESYFLGEDKMIGAYTLTEEYQTKELLFSFQKKTSWLSFNDSFLPIFKKIIVFRRSQLWNYILFELRDTYSSGEYIAVEKEAPFRILVEKKRGDIRPKIIKASDKVLRTPEEFNVFQKLFYWRDPGFLKEL